MFTGLRRLSLVLLFPVLPHAAVVTSHAVAAAQTVCEGDCDGTGQVTVSGVMTLVNIVLGNSSSSACTAGIPTGGMVDVAVLLHAVHNALGTCPTPAVPDVSGVWTEEQLHIVSSTCNAATAEVIARLVAELPPVCDSTLSQAGMNVHDEDCTGESQDGTVDAAGTIRFTAPDRTETVADGCDLTVGGDLVIDASHSPTTAQYTLQLTFNGACLPFASCTSQLQSRWTKQ